MTFAPRDYKGLEEAVALLMDDGGGPPKRGVGSRESGVASIPLGHRMWLEHVLALDELAGVVQLRGEDLQEEEARGLAILRKAREKYRSEHERCAGCGQVKRSGSFCKNGCKGQ